MLIVIVLHYSEAGEVAEDMPGTHSDPPTPTLQADGGESRPDTAVIPESFQLPEFLSRAVQVSSLFHVCKRMEPSLL